MKLDPIAYRVVTGLMALFFGRLLSDLGILVMFYTGSILPSFVIVVLILLIFILSVELLQRSLSRTSGRK